MTDSTQGGRREDILAAAEKVFEANGYAAATVDAVAAAAGVAKGSIYNYFKSKQDLFTQLFSELIARQIAGAEALTKAPSPAAEKIDAILSYWSERLEEFKRVGALVLEFWATAARQQRRGELRTMLRGFYAQSREMIAGVLAEGDRNGEFTLHYEPTVAASLILAVLDGIEVHSILDVGVEVNEEFIAGLKHAVMTGLTAEPRTDNPKQSGNSQ